MCLSLDFYDDSLHMSHVRDSKSNPHTFVEHVELRQQQIVPDGSCFGSL